jgi:Tetratricopeptide repeat
MLVSVRPDDTEDWLLTLNDLSRLLRGARRLARAAEVLLQALGGWERHRGPDDQNTLSAAHKLAVVLIDLGRADDARGLLRNTVARRARSSDPLITTRSVAAMRWRARCAATRPG